MSGADAVVGRSIVREAGHAERATVVAYACALVGADATAAVVSLEISLACFAALLFMLLSHLLLVPLSPQTRAALMALCLVPVLKIAAAALPQQLVPEAYWELLPCVLVLATIALLRGATGWTIIALPRPRVAAWAAQLVVAAGGPALALAAAYTLSAVDDSVPRPEYTTTPVAVLCVAAVSGLTLEIVFRGIIQSALLRLLGPLGWLAAALLYAGLFASTGSGFIVGVAAITGLLWGAAAGMTRATVGVAASHALFAVTWALLY